MFHDHVLFLQSNAKSLLTISSIPRASTLFLKGSVQDTELEQTSYSEKHRQETQHVASYHLPPSCCQMIAAFTPPPLSLLSDSECNLLPQLYSGQLSFLSLEIPLSIPNHSP